MFFKFVLFVFTVTLVLIYIIFRFAFVVYWKSLMILRKCKNLNPGPKAYPLFGYPQLLLASQDDLLDIMDEIYSTSQPPCPLWIGPACHILLNLEQSKELLKNPRAVHKSVSYKVLEPLLGNGLLTSKVSTWRVHRRLLQPVYMPKPINHCINLVSYHTQILVDKWKSNLDKGEFDVHESLCSVAFAPLLGMWFGLELEDISITPAQFLWNVGRLKYIGMEKLLKPWIYNNLLFKFTALEKEETKLREELRSWAAEIYQVSKAAMEKVEAEQAEVPSENQIGRLIDLLGRQEFLDKNKFTYEDVIDEIITGFTGGADTVLFTMSFILLMLAYYPEKQENVYQELYEIYGSNDVAAMPITSNDLPKMKYLECFIKETMRIFAPIPIISRVLEEDEQIAGTTIAKGAPIFIFLSAMHRENTWKNPLEFLPERHLSTNSDNDPEMFLPFSKGARGCPGQKYAYMEMKTAIAIILRHYVIKSDNIVPLKDVKINVSMFSELFNPVTIRIEERL